MRASTMKPTVNEITSAAIGKVQLEEIITNFRKLGVEKVGSCHCTGELARQIFKQEYDNDFLDVGVGRLIEFE